MAQLNNFKNSMSDHPELEELLNSVNLDLDNLLIQDDEEDKNDNDKKEKK